MSTAQISHEIEIDASPTTVWSVLTDTVSYPDWNPFLRRLDGELRAGAHLVARVAPPGGRAMTFRPTVLAAEPARELRWLGRFLVPGLLDGEHAFRLEPLAGGGTRFVQSERFRGILVRFLGTTFARTRCGFAEMNEALRLRAEAVR